jgi:hypothetical protein
LFVYLNTGDGFDNGKQWQANLGGDVWFWIDKKSFLISLWVFTKYSIK